MKILIVDDELVSRKKLQKILEEFGDCELAPNGTAAIVAFQNAHDSGKPFDLLFLDISMPDLLGTEVLDEIRKIEMEKKIPLKHRAKIIMATSHTDKKTVVNSIQAGCDEYISKPIRPQVIIEKFEKIGLVPEPKNQNELPNTENNIMKALISRFKTGDFRLPSLPRICQKFYELCQMTANYHEIADILKRDLSISSKLISISNSAFYRGVVENNTIEQAVSRLGLGATKQLVDALCNRKLFNTQNKKYARILEKLWEHSIACAYASQNIAELLKLEVSDEIFTMGMMHDIGKLVLIHVVTEMETKAQFQNDVSRSALVSMLAKLHCDFGPALLKRWNYSDRYVQIAQFHNNLEKAEIMSKELLIVDFANILVKSMGYSLEHHAGKDLASVESGRQLGLDAPMIDRIQELTADQIESGRELLM